MNTDTLTRSHSSPTCPPSLMSHTLTLRPGKRSVARPEIRFDGPLQLHCHGIAVAIHRFAGDDAHPALADAILLDIVAFDAVEADADTALEQLLVEERALRI